MTRCTDAPGDAYAPDAGPLRPLLSGLRPLFPPALLSGSGFERVLSIADGLPAIAAGHMGFEVRLDDPAPAADVCAALYPRGPFADWLASTGADAPAGTSRAALACLAERYTRGTAAWARISRLVIFEYDALDSPPADRLPGVFLILDTPVAITPRVARGAVAAAAEGVRRALGLPGLTAVRGPAERVLFAFAGCAKVSNVGVFPSRPGAGVRLVLAGLDPQAAAFALAAADWSGPSGRLAAVCRDLRPAVQSFGLSLDVDASGLGSRVGLELFAGPAGGAWAAGSPDDWTPLLHALTETGRCLPPKADALRAWIGRSRVFTPSGLRVACRGVNHVKVDFGPADPAVKAYLGLALIEPAPPGDREDPPRS